MYALPFISAGVEGTEFLVRVEPDRSLVSVFEGQVAAVNDKGRLSIGSGQSVSAAAGDKPRLVTVVRPRDAVQWALYYQPILTALVDASADGEMIGLPAAVRGAISRGELTEAFNALEGVPTAQRDEDYHVVRAGLLLAVGRVEQARMAIEQAFAVNPASSQGRALQAIIAVTRNDKAGAFSLASEAVSLDARSVAARLALSYAQQAQFDLPAALESVQAAVAAHPQNALAWARLAELWLTQGELDRALESAQKAVALSPELAHTQTVLGFAHLTQIKTVEAKQAFNQAIQLDQAAPLPRLGLGLAKIREGELEAGRKELEIAVSLDPDNSVYRSYMGKAYYEEKREELATAQYEMAKELDPLDPTPWLYDALLKQTENRPVEALSDLQQSIELNDNRAVYRSRLLLDEDLAARSASLARIYQDLGFEQLALVEGWKSVNADPGDYSGHRFLADTYSTLPRHEIARVSELLQSQLRQPINTTAIQPQLAESNLFILDGAGPSRTSFNEFHRLFTQDGLTLQANGIVGNNSTWGDDLVVSGIFDNLSISAGQFHYETDGFRENNDLKEDIYNIFAQMQLSPNTSIQTEYRHRDSESGDLNVLFDPDAFLMERRQRETDSFRFGLYHAFSRKADFIVNISANRINEDVVIPEITRTTFDDEGFIAEIQHRIGMDDFELISGIGHVDTDQTLDIELLAFSDPPTISNADIKHDNVYLYSYINSFDNLAFTFGASADFFTGQDIEINQVNPKFGVIWTPTSVTTLRATAFRTLKRTLLTNQTIEPTQVAGLNQFFDDAEGTDAWRYGAAIDHKLFSQLYMGLEYSRRDLDSPSILAFPGLTTTITEDFDEQLGRAYVYWVPHSRWAFSGEYQYEVFDRDISILGLGNFTELNIHRFSLGGRFSHPSGFRANMKAIFIDQDGQFGDIDGNLIPGDDQFWTVDASIGYRLPKRSGLIALIGKNIFKKKFNFQDTDPANPSIFPDRSVFFQVNLFF